MARLTQLCLATLALFVVVATAAPCQDNVDIIEHEIEDNYGSEDVYDDFGDNYVDDSTFGDCYEYSPCPEGGNHGGNTGGSTGGHSGGHTGGSTGGSTGGGNPGVGVGGGSDDGGDDSLIGVEAGFIGVNDVNGQEALVDAVDLRRLDIHDLVQGVGAL